MIISKPCWHIKYANRPAIVIKNSWLIGAYLKLICQQGVEIIIFQFYKLLNTRLIIKIDCEGFELGHMTK